MKKLKEDNIRDRGLSPSEEAAILDKAPDWLKPIVIFALNTAMREGEICNLKWEVVEREGGRAVLGGFIRVGTESKTHAARHVPINSRVKDILDAQVPVSTPGLGINPYVFAHPTSGKARTASAVAHAFDLAAEKAAVTRVVFHTLRHTACSRMIAAGIPEAKVMLITGHKTNSMVRRYTHLGLDSARGATDCLAGDFGAHERNDSVTTG